VELRNTDIKPWTGWTAAFSFPGDEKVTTAWNATVTQTSAGVTATNLSYNGNVAVNATTTFGFQGTWSASSAAPTAFTVNGNTCTTN
jgi:hypothetical protein